MPKKNVYADSCPRFDTRQGATVHAANASEYGQRVRYLIKTGDAYFSSTTGDVQKYEKLIAIYRNGVELAPAEAKEYMHRPIFY